MPGTLYLVATPIGNLSDISARAVETLKAVDIVACEDTRHTQKLLNHLGIKAKTVSYHAHNENERATELAKKLADGISIAVVSDAGTPGINDPGHCLVEWAIETGSTVVPIPGPAAFVGAVIVSGLATESIFFGGFLPAKKGERRKRLEEVKLIPATLAFYETPHRIAAALNDCIDILGDREASFSREITKIHEETVRGKISVLLTHISSAKPRGEFVLVIDRARESEKTPISDSSKMFANRVGELESTGLGRKKAMKQAAKEFGLTRSEAYRKLQTS
jgi:16S rRNA (cytidine1402-2'-O)-methyltransferase